MLKSPISRALLLAGTSLLAITPFFWWGSPSGHDFEFHVFSWMEVLGQWKHGIMYPRWAALAHWGYGEARFLFYPPASWTLGAALGAVLPWAIVPGTYCWIVLTLAAASMYRLAREWLPVPDALFAAVFYALNPYHLLIIFWRSAYAELLAAPILPLIVLCLVKLQEPALTQPDLSAGQESRKPGSLATFRPTLWLSLLLAAAWLTNAPAAVMIHYSTAGLALLLAARAARSRSWGPHVWRPLRQTALAIVFGISLAGFYLLPTIYEQRWIDLTQVMAPGVRPQDNFLFTHTADADHNRFNLLVSTLAAAEFGALALATWLLRRWQSKRAESIGLDSPITLSPPIASELSVPDNHGNESDRRPWILFPVWGTASALFMLSLSNFFWQHLPKFRFVQLPFRWLLCLNVSLAILLTVATKRWTLRLLTFSALLLTLVVAGHRIQPPWWDTADDLQEMSDDVTRGTGYEGTDEYVPAGADAYELNKSLPLISDDAGAPVHSDILAWGPTEKHFVVHAPAAQDITVRLFSYPAWQVLVNGKVETTDKTEVTGLIVIAVDAGDSDIHIFFRRTTDRRVGDIVSLISLLLFVIVWSKVAHKLSWASSNRPSVAPANLEPHFMTSRVLLVATSNAGKLRDFAGAAAPHGIVVTNIPNFSSRPQVVEDGASFEENARKKAEAYSIAAPGELVLADDSGLEIDALGGAPGVHSARYAAADLHNAERQAAESSADDEANNARVLRQLKGVPEQKRTARFVCVLALARDGQTVRTFRGSAEGIILEAPRGEQGFGYDSLFFFSQIGKTFAELSAREKAEYSHRGAAFRELLQWMDPKQVDR